MRELTGWEYMMYIREEIHRHKERNKEPYLILLSPQVHKSLLQVLAETGMREFQDTDEISQIAGYNTVVVKQVNEFEVLVKGRKA